MIFFATPICQMLTQVMPGNCGWHSYVTGCGVCVSSLVWYITGLVWRYNAVGKFSCGDDTDAVADIQSVTLMQTESGNFMRIYYLITWILFATICCCGCSVAIFTQCISK